MQKFHSDPSDLVSLYGTPPEDDETIQFNMRLHVSRKEIIEEKALRSQHQVERWQQESSSGSVPPLVRLVTLLNAGAHHEIGKINARPLSSYGGATARTARREKLCRIADVRQAYRNLIDEGRRLLQCKLLEGARLDEQSAIVVQAVACFASMFPWSDSVLLHTAAIGELPSLGSHTVRGKSHGVVVVKSFAAAASCSLQKGIVAQRNKDIAMRQAQLYANVLRAALIQRCPAVDLENTEPPGALKGFQSPQNKPEGAADDHRSSLDDLSSSDGADEQVAKEEETFTRQNASLW